MRALWSVEALGYRGSDQVVSPKVIAASNGTEQEFTSRLVAGADGQVSRTRGWGGFEVQNPLTSFS